jgi:hypothetical protein
MSGHHQGAVHDLCAWVDRHLPDFLSPPTAVDGLIPLEDVKCAGELLLVSFALTAPGMDSVPALQLWARRTGRSLGSHMGSLGEGVDWARLPQRIADESSSGHFLMVYPLLAAVTGQQGRFHDHALETLRAVSRLGAAGALDMDLRFALQLCGARTVRSTMRSDLLDSLLACSATPRGGVSSSEYTLTHAIFYLTEFGRRPPRLPAVVARRLRAYLADTAPARVGGGDLDIGAELLLSQACVGAHRNRGWHEALRLLASRAAPDHAAAAVEPRPPCTARSEFERDYHLVLVTLAAVASGVAASRDHPAGWRTGRGRSAPSRPGPRRRGSPTPSPRR